VANRPNFRACADVPEGTRLTQVAREECSAMVLLIGLGVDAAEAPALNGIN
jgi:hypothetical protein